MAFFANDSAIKVAPGSELEKAVSAATSVSEIQQILFQAAQDQHLIQRDEFDTEGRNHFAFRQVDPGTQAAAKGVAKVLVVDGQKHVIEGKDDAELAVNELALMRRLFAGAPAATTQEQTRDAAGRFIAAPSQEQIAAEAERVDALNEEPADRVQGDIVEKALASRGIKIETLRQLEDSNLQNAWKSASDEFLQTSAWPGGTANIAKMSEVLIAMHAEENPSVANLRAAFDYMVQNNLLVEPTERIIERKVAEATDYESLKAAVGYHDIQENGGGFWGR